MVMLVCKRSNVAKVMWQYTSPSDTSRDHVWTKPSQKYQYQNISGISRGSGHLMVISWFTVWFSVWLLTRVTGVWRCELSYLMPILSPSVTSVSVALGSHAKRSGHSQPKGVCVFEDSLCEVFEVSVMNQSEASEGRGSWGAPQTEGQL